MFITRSKHGGCIPCGARRPQRGHRQGYTEFRPVMGGALQSSPYWTPCFLTGQGLNHAVTAIYRGAWKYRPWDARLSPQISGSLVLQEEGEMDSGGRLAASNTIPQVCVYTGLRTHLSFPFVPKEKSGVKRDCWVRAVATEALQELPRTACQKFVPGHPQGNIGTCLSLRIFSVTSCPFDMQRQHSVVIPCAFL